MIEIGFTFALDVFERRDRVLQVLNDLRADLPGHDTAHNHQTGGRQPDGTEEQSKKKFSAKSHESIENCANLATVLPANGGPIREMSLTYETTN